MDEHARDDSDGSVDGMYVERSSLSCSPSLTHLLTNRCDSPLLASCRIWSDKSCFRILHDGRQC